MQLVQCVGDWVGESAVVAALDVGTVAAVQGIAPLAPADVVQVVAGAQAVGTDGVARATGATADGLGREGHTPFSPRKPEVLSDIQQPSRVDGRARRQRASSGFEVQVRSEAVAGAAGQADDRTTRHPRADRDRDP